MTSSSSSSSSSRGVVGTSPPSRTSLTARRLELQRRSLLPIVGQFLAGVHLLEKSQTCLSRGGGYHFPPSHILNICGFRILLDCPIDLSPLLIFSPVPSHSHAVLDEDASDSSTHITKRQKTEQSLDASNLVYAEPWYKTVNSLHLWNVSFIDIVLISSPMGMLGLPFLTRLKGFSAKIYVTEAASRLGQLMMEDLVAMHMEFRQFYGLGESGFPQWMKWEELQLLPSALKEIALGKDGTELGGWMPLYSAADVKDCMRKVQTLKYAEEACYNGTLIIKALSSGLEIGTCNWTINGPKRSIACINSSIFVSALAMNFDYQGLQGNDLILYSDFSSLNATEDMEDNSNNSAVATLSDGKNSWEDLTECLLSTDENVEEKEKLAFMCSCIVDSVTAGGSVLVTISQLGTVLQLLEQISCSLESSSLKVPIYMISTVAAELLAYTNIVPEWLCKQRQEKLFSGEPLFSHVELMKEKKLQVFPAVHSPTLLTNWQEPCIIFSPHWSLRLGPAVHLLRRWCGDQNSLLVLEDGVDANLALLPFKPIAMKVLQCSFLSGLKLQKVQPLLKILQPKLVLFPEVLRQQISFSDASSFSLVPYSENETLRVPSVRDCSELEIASDFYLKLIQDKKQIARLKGELLVFDGKQRLIPGNKESDSPKSRPLLHWGSPDLERLLTVLSKMGINGCVEQNMSDTESENVSALHVHDPNKAVVEVRATGTIISVADKNFATQIFEAIDSMLDGI